MPAATIGAVINGCFLSTIINRGQLDTPRAMNTKVKSTRGATSKDGSFGHWKLSGFQLSQSAQHGFDMLAKLFKRKGRRMKSYHAVKDTIK